MLNIFSNYDIKLVEDVCRHLHIMVPPVSPVSLARFLLVPSIRSITAQFPYVGDAFLVRNFCYKLMLEESIYEAFL
jgi:hypothetical protein